MVVLPGDKYYAIPREALEQYAIPKADFDAELIRSWQAKDTVFHAAKDAGVPFPWATRSTMDPLSFGAHAEMRSGGWENWLGRAWDTLSHGGGVGEDDEGGGNSVLGIRG